MAFPAGAISASLDARIQSQFTLSSVMVTDGGRFDTANGWTANNTLWWDSMALGNGPCFFIGGIGRFDIPTPSWLSIASLSIGIPFSIGIVFRADNNAALCELSAGVGSGRGVLIQSGGGWTARINGPSALSYNDHPSGQLWAANNTVHYLILTCDGTTTKLYVDGILTKISTDGVAPGTGSFSVASTIGAAHGGAMPLVGAIGAVQIYNRVFSAADITQFDTEVRGSWRLTSTTDNLIKYNCIQTGASISAGAHTTSDNANQPNYPYDYVSTAISQLGQRFGSVQQLAVSGQTLVQQNTAWIANVGALVSGRINIGILGGDAANNDLSGSSVATTNANMATHATRMAADLSAASAGGTVQQYQIIWIPETGGLNGGIPSVNSNTRANYTSWGAAHVTQILVDCGSDAAMSSIPGFSSYLFTDNVHPAKPGHQRLSVYFANALIAAGL